MRKQHTNILVSVTLLFMMYLAGFYTGRNWNHGAVQISHVVSARESVVAAVPTSPPAAATLASHPETQPAEDNIQSPQIQPVSETEPVANSTEPPKTPEEAEATAQSVSPTQAPAQPEQTKPEQNNSGLININTASAATLETLPGIGEVLAQRIVEYRQVHGPFQSVYALTNVKGIGEKRLAAIINLITV